MKEELKLDVTLSEIKQMSKNTFKNKVKKSVSREAFKWLSLKKTELKKVKNVKHETLEIQKYLTSSILSVEQTQFLFHLRTKMLFLRNNYKNMQKEEFCPLCEKTGQKHLDNQEHLLECKMLDTVTDLTEQQLSYNDMYSDDLTKQDKITIVLESKYKLRKILEENITNT